MKKAQIKKSVSALAMAAVIAVSLFGYGCGAKPASTSSDAGVSGNFTGTAKGFGGDVSVTLTLTDGAITGCTAEGKDETQGVGSEAIAKMPGEIAESGSIAVDGVSGATVTSTAIKEAAAAALTAAGLNPDDYKTAVEKTGSAEDSTVEADVVVVGAGGAGMTAAITAAGEGKSVVILESQSMVGGNSVRATGGMNAGKTVYQDENEFGESAGVEKTLKTAAEKYADNETITALAKTVSEQWAAYQANPTGYFDSVELMELDTMIGGKGINDPELVETLCANSADAIDWLDEHGITLHNVSSFGGASVKRIHRPVNAEGKTVSVGSYMIPLLQENCEKAGVKMMLDTTATEILTDANGAAVGVKATGASGETVTVNAKAVVLASGGFGANLDMVVKYKPELKGFMTTNAPGIQGQGIEMAQAIGAATVDMDQIQIHPTVEANTAALITEGLRGDGAVLINAEGKRFIDEVGTRDVVSAAEIAQTGSYSWLVVDQAMVDASSVIQGYIKKGYTVTGATYEELGKAMGVDAAAFAETMDKWNGYVEAKNDPDFGRTSFANPLNTAPYYAVKVTAGVHHTMGGLKINANTEVLNEKGEVIPGLFAAGEVTGGVHGANRLGGNAVADFTVFGRIAGAAASDYAA
ncbi:flavocytochrome c [Faecalibacterium prausnitzii]|uniref:Urocanate reductase n=1 Tax=Faecalibacterium prausnitzii TaxID=853 RepID=A0AAX1QKF9_9FIRM|nr:flavocytochrome c [Faecalibacterium prausnitzii]AXA82954.1 flavocytochrome c [Faecalibacterium prausnitzii]RAW52638.1 flavocytochrome c [Faecalibacterium prausnitzii]